MSLEHYFTQLANHNLKKTPKRVRSLE